MTASADDRAPGGSPAQSWQRQVENAIDAATRAMPASDLVSQFDPASFGEALSRLGTNLAASPMQTAAAVADYWTGAFQAASAGVLRSLGQDASGPLADPPKDKRFSDPAWEQNPWYYVLRQQHLLLERLVDELLSISDEKDGGRQDDKAEFLLRQLVDAAAPTNTLLGNPVAVRRAYETGGASAVRGARNFVNDLASNGGRPRQTVAGQFVVGKDLAATSGKVVFRNEMMELLQYSPQTEQVREVPLLLSPPWINKYYMMDLAP